MNIGTTINIVLGVLASIIICQFGILLKIIPYENIWGGNLTNDIEMMVFTFFSLTITIVLAFALLIKGNYVDQLISFKAVNLILWCFPAFFALDAIGNLLGKTNLENSLAMLTLGLSIFLWSLRNQKKSMDNNGNGDYK